MPTIFNLLSKRLSSLLPSELMTSELPQLLLPQRQPLLLSQRRAMMIVNRVRLFAFLFAIPTVFYIASHTLLGGFELTQFSAAVATGYAFLPFVLMAGLAIFPLTLLENMVLASLLLLAQAVAGYMSWSTLNWPSFAGGFWLLMLIAAVTALASMSQLAFMVALVRQAIRDPLTGILSRGSGEEILNLQWSTVERCNGSLALAFIDLDHFKTVNDTFGHEAGDRVLLDFTQALSSKLRSSDTLLRWGGEEFLLIMPSTDMAQARKALERLLDAGFGWRPDGKPLTASIGLAERCYDRALSARHLLELADQRMYLAKSNGRNQVYAHSPAANPPAAVQQAAVLSSA